MKKHNFFILPNLLLHILLYIGLWLTMYSTLYAQTSPMVGTWGYKELGIRDGKWLTENNSFIYKSDGSGLLEYTRHYEGDPVEVGTQEFYYASKLNSDGSYTDKYFINKDEPENGDATIYAACDDGKVFIVGQAVGLNKLELSVGVKLDTTKNYNNSDLTGDYYAIGYEHDKWGYGSGFYRAWSTIISFNGYGSYSMTSTWNGDGVIRTEQSNGTYLVSAKGAVTLDVSADPLHLSGDGKLGVWSNPHTEQDWANYIIMKRGDKNYTTSDLAGSWAIAGFGDKSGQSIHADFGSMVCDSKGNCTTSTKTRSSNGKTNYESVSETFAVAADGRLVSSIPSSGPNYESVIGNNGNTIFINRSFSPTNLNSRKIYVAVRCSGCSNLSGQGKGIPATNFLLLRNN